MFVTLFLVPFCVGFAAFAFWWRLRLLLPAIAVGVFLFAIASGRVPNADGPSAFMVMAAFIFLSNGAASGVVASTLIIVGRRTNLSLLRPMLVLPLLLPLGFGSYFAWTVLR